MTVDIFITTRRKRFASYKLDSFARTAYFEFYRKAVTFTAKIEFIDKEDSKRKTRR